MANELTLEEFAKNVSKSTDEARLALAQQLDAAGFWDGKVSSKFDIKYYTALTKLEAAYQQQAAVDKLIESESSTKRLDVLTNTIAEGGSGDGGPKTTAQTYITSASQTSKILDAVAQDLIERKLTDAEKAKYLKIINQEQRRQPSIQTTGEGFVTTRGGVDEEALLREKIGATAEAKTASATDAYTIMLEELGGLR
jgi:hypothetical protein